MQIDIDYIRELLLDSERNDSYQIFVHRRYYGDDREEKKEHHANLLCEVGLLKRNNDTLYSGLVYRMTNEGHEFTATIRDESTWQSIKVIAGKYATPKTLKRIVLEHNKAGLGEKLKNREMYNLIVLGALWNWQENSKAEMEEYDRFLTYTSDQIISRFDDFGQDQLDRLKVYPCLFMNEGINDELAHVGEITKISRSGKLLKFEYTFYQDIRPVPNLLIYNKMASFDIRDGFEFSRTHWALKDVNLFRTLLTLPPPRKSPKVFEIDQYQDIDNRSVSVMMPFAAEFDPVHRSIQHVAEKEGLFAKRVDDIWEKDAIIQDIVNLIDSSSIVVCDCTGKNPNVFYELGIAHTLGRDVIMITQNPNDIPFDVGHIRYIPYHNNNEGLQKLGEELRERFKTLKD
ncbi:MAG: DUF2513 domain-containing protein [Paracoccaceae bacterium]|nr:DUF2513 domain-containing protein [Paracoccaceae bacterium]MYJ86828.1 DUF2513 domain-containing protein [Paracoccaceae bacterium]